MSMGFRASPIEKNDDELYFPLLPNVSADENWTMCLNKSNRNKKSNLDLTNLDLTGVFWQSAFYMYGSMSSHQWLATTLLADTPLRSLKHWAKLTKKHGSPDFMLDFDYIYKNIAQRVGKRKAFRMLK